jgi:hypothetical protein
MYIMYMIGLQGDLSACTASALHLPLRKSIAAPVWLPRLAANSYALFQLAHVALDKELSVHFAASLLVVPAHLVFISTAGLVCVLGTVRHARWPA